MDIQLEVGASSGEVVKSISDLRKELVQIREENLKLNQEFKSRNSEAIGAEQKLAQTFVGTAKALEVQKKLSAEVRQALKDQQVSGKDAGDATTKSTNNATKALEAQKKTLQALKDTQANLQKNGVTGAPVTNTQRAIDNAQAEITRLETQALNDNSDAIQKNEQKTLSLKAQKRQLTEQIASLLAQGINEGQEFTDLTNKAGQLDDAIRDANAAIRLTGSDTRGLDTAVQVVGGLAGAYSAAEGAAALFGEQNEFIQEGLLKVNAAMAIANGLEQIGNVLTNERIKADVLRYAGQIKQNIQQVISNGLESESVVIRSAATVAQRILNATMAANPIGAIATVLATLIGLFLTYKLTIGSVSDEERDRIATLETLRKIQADAAQQTIEQTQALKNQIAVLQDGNATFGQKEETLKKVRESYPEYLGFLNQETINTNQTSEAIERQIAHIAKKQLAISAEKNLVEALQEQTKAQAKLTEESTTYEKVLDAIGALNISGKYANIADAEKKVTIATNILKGAQSDLNGVSHRTTDELKSQVSIYQALAQAIPGYSVAAAAAISQLNSAIQANTAEDTKKTLDDRKKSLDIQLAMAKDNSKAQFEARKGQILNNAALEKAEAEKTIVDAKGLAKVKEVIDAQAAKATRDLNKEYADINKERLQGQIEANNKLQEVRAQLTEAQVNIQKDGLKKEQDLIKLEYQQRIAAVQQSIKAEELRIQGNDKVGAQERAAVVAANDVRRKLILQLKANENKELEEADRKHFIESTDLQLQFDRQKLELQQDSLDKSLALVQIEADEKINAARVAFKDYPEKIAEIEIKAEQEKNRKLVAVRVQFAQDQLDQQEETAKKSVELIQDHGQDEGRITKLKNVLIAKIESDAAKARLQLLKSQFDKENKLILENITKQFSAANIKAAAESGVDIFEFLGINLEGTPEEIAKAKAAILDAIEKIKNGVQVELNHGSKIDTFGAIFSDPDASGSEKFRRAAELITKFVEKTKEAIDAILKAYNSYLDGRKEQIQRDIDQDDARLAKAQEALDQELEFKRKGYANNVQAKQDEVDKINKQREKDLQNLKEIQKEQARIGIAMQETALAVSIAKMIEAVSAIIDSGAQSGGYVGAIAAVVAAAGVVAGFIELSNSVKAYKAMRKGGDLDLMEALTGQPSHERGGVDVVNTRTGQKLAELEGDEKLFVVNKGSGAKYYNILKAINDGSISNWGYDEFSAINPGNIQPSDTRMKDELLPGLIAKGDRDITERKDVRVIHGGFTSEQHLRRIAISNEQLLELERDKETFYEDGDDLIIKKGNSIRRIKRNND